MDKWFPFPTKWIVFRLLLLLSSPTTVFSFRSLDDGSVMTSFWSGCGGNIALPTNCVGRVGDTIGKIWAEEGVVIRSSPSDYGGRYFLLGPEDCRISCQRGGRYTKITFNMPEPNPFYAVTLFFWPALWPKIMWKVRGQVSSVVNGRISAVIDLIYNQRNWKKFN